MSQRQASRCSHAAPTRPDSHSIRADLIWDTYRSLSALSNSDSASSRWARSRKAFLAATPAMRSARSRSPRAQTANAVEVTIPTKRIAATLASAAASDRFLLHHRHVRATRPIGRAWIASPPRYRRRSSARLLAVPYRLSGSFSKHFRQAVSRSRGTTAFSFRRAGGSSFRI